MAELDKVAVVLSVVSLACSLIGMSFGVFYYGCMRKNLKDLKKIIVLIIKNGRYA